MSLSIDLVAFFDGAKAMIDFVKASDSMGLINIFVGAFTVLLAVMIFWMVSSSRE